eukprot:1378999-Amorphochlora_amoeboformis.AAC.1
MATSRDWEHREFIQEVQFNILKICQFLNNFGTKICENMQQATLSPKSRKPNYKHLCPFKTSIFADTTVRYRLSKVDAKLTVLERQME